MKPHLLKGKKHPFLVYGTFVYSGWLSLAFEFIEFRNILVTMSVLISMTTLLDLSFVYLLSFSLPSSFTRTLFPPSPSFLSLPFRPSYIPISPSSPYPHPPHFILALGFRLHVHKGSPRRPLREERGRLDVFMRVSVREQSESEGLPVHVQVFLAMWTRECIR